MPSFYNLVLDSVHRKLAGCTIPLTRLLENSLFLYSEKATLGARLLIRFTLFTRLGNPPELENEQACNIRKKKKRKRQNDLTNQTKTFQII